MNLDELRARTRAEHEATEALLPLMDPQLTRAAYASALARLYAVIQGWELWAEDNAPERFRPLLLSRQRSSLLLRDLDRMDWVPVREALPQSTFAVLYGDESPSDAPLEPSARFAGALYVVEGSTLGGQYIARHVEEVFGFRVGEGDAYFRGCGERTGMLWREVKGVLGALPDSMLDETVEGAKRMFGIFATALRAPLSQPATVDETERMLLGRVPPPLSAR